MSQCYSGGFHQLSVGEGRDGLPNADGRVCGFTSTTERRIAAGCTPDVDAVRYQGYERTFTEQLTRTDVVRGTRLGGDSPPDLRTTHRRAALLDLTLDIPLSTTEYYLLQWSAALAGKDFKPRAGKMGAARAVRIARDTALGRLNRNALVAAAGPLRSDVRDLHAYIQDLERALDRADRGLRSRDQSGLERRLSGLGDMLGQVRGRRARDQKDYAALRARQVYPVWRRALEEGQTGLDPEAARIFEPRLLKLSLRAGNRDSWDQVVEQRFLVELHGLSLRDPPAAERYADYFARREATILDWAENANNLNLGEVVGNLRRLAKRSAGLQDRAWHLEKQRGLTLRLHHMRSALGALVALGAMRDTKALDDIRKLRDCETTPLPIGRR